MSDSACVFPWQWSLPLVTPSLAGKTTWDMDPADSPEDAGPPAALVEHPHLETLLHATADLPPEALPAV